MKLSTMVLIAMVAAGQAGAQQTSPDTVIVMTVPLKYISTADAVGLLAPYATTTAMANVPAGGVFPVPGGRAITIRERLPQYGRMLSLLARYDKPPRALNFFYQIILADNSGRRSPEIASLDSVLRTSLKYTGYRVIGSGTLRGGASSEGNATAFVNFNRFDLKMAWNDPLGIASDAAATLLFAQLDHNQGDNSMGMVGTVFKTSSITIPLGQTVVLGSGVLDQNQAIILVMRPELAGTGGKRDDE